MKYATVGDIVSLINLSHTIIESARLHLVPISPEYREEIFHEFTDEITEHMVPSTPKSIVETDAFIEKSQQSLRVGSELTLVVLDKQTSEFLGGAGLHKIDSGNPEFGIWVKRSAQGKGYGKEIIAAIKQWANTHLEFEFFIYNAAKANVASRKLAESFGGKIMSEFLQKTAKNPERESVSYRISR